ncbi:unnamed protein product [Choristocarpus tenellus]
MVQALNKSLSWDQIATRPGGGGKKVHYLAAGTVIENANKIFGFNGWESSILHLSTDYLEKTPDGKFFVAAVTCIVKVAVKDGAGHEDVGHAHLKDKDKGEALERAKKAAVTDATKRALRLFGPHLGSQMTDKQGIIDMENLHKREQREQTAQCIASKRGGGGADATGAGGEVSSIVQPVVSMAMPHHMSEETGPMNGPVHGHSCGHLHVLVRGQQHSVGQGWGHGEKQMQDHQQGQGQRLGQGQEQDQQQEEQDRQKQQQALLPQKLPLQPWSARSGTEQGKVQQQNSVPGNGQGQGQGKGQGQGQGLQKGPQAQQEDRVQSRRLSPQVSVGVAAFHDSSSTSTLQRPKTHVPLRLVVRGLRTTVGGPPNGSWVIPEPAHSPNDSADLATRKVEPSQRQSPGPGHGGHQVCPPVHISVEQNRNDGGSKMVADPSIVQGGAALAVLRRSTAGGMSIAGNGDPRHDEYGGYGGFSQVDESALAEIDTAIQRHALSGGSGSGEGEGEKAGQATRNVASSHCEGYHPDEFIPLREGDQETQGRSSHQNKKMKQ